MTKPFSPSELVARVKAHLSRYKRLTSAGQETNEVIEIRDLVIDKTARRVILAGEEKTFTTKERLSIPIKFPFILFYLSLSKTEIEKSMEGK